MRYHNFILCFLLILTVGCQFDSTPTHSSMVIEQQPFSWRSANVYFLLTDRFYNGNISNDTNFDRTESTATLRGFEGGDIRGITQKIREGYFDTLGINAIWLTPVVEQIHGATDEGTGQTYAYHGYWAKDWTALDPNFGTTQDLAEMVSTAHSHGIRILLDVVLNHTGPVTDMDRVWPSAWVRTSPTCAFENYETTVSCTLVDNLPDIHTETDEAVELPGFLKEKWDREGRLQKETAALDSFFQATQYPRSPRFYIIKWLTDFIRIYGIDGFRVDTAKHTEAFVWAELKAEAQKAFKHWQAKYPDKVLDSTDFFMVGEVYNYFADQGRAFDYGDKKVDFFDHGFESLINFSFKEDASESYEHLFHLYDTLLHKGALQEVGVLNYLTSHDDGAPFDPEREKTMEAGTRLLLTPGAAQVYYGDETARPLQIEGAVGDANLRSMMNWDQIGQDSLVTSTLNHWARLGRFRRDHIAVGDGTHQMRNEKPYIFSRIYTNGEYNDKVLIGLDMKQGEKAVKTYDVFNDGDQVVDYYSGQEAVVTDGMLHLNTPHAILLLAVKP